MQRSFPIKRNIEERIMEPIKRRPQQSVMENALEALLLCLCLAASVYGVVALDTLPLSI